MMTSISAIHCYCRKRIFECKSSSNHYKRSKLLVVFIPMMTKSCLSDNDLLRFAESQTVHRVSKKLCQLIHCSFSVKKEPISIKIGRIVPEETLNKTVPRMSTSPKLCACTTLGNLK